MFRFNLEDIRLTTLLPIKIKRGLEGNIYISKAKAYVAKTKLYKHSLVPHKGSQILIISKTMSHLMQLPIALGSPIRISHEVTRKCDQCLSHHV